MVIVINPKITISNRTAYTLIAIVILLSIVGVAYAIGSGDPYIHGHDASELNISFSYKTSTYSRDSDGDGTRTQNMGGHLFCVLSRVAPGGFNSHCRVYLDGNNWKLEAVDPDDQYSDTQRCNAMCFDLN